MLNIQKVCLLLTCLACWSCGRRVHLAEQLQHEANGPSKPKSEEECKTICQRFGMKSLGSDYGDNPGTCSEHCAVVFGAEKHAPAPTSQSFVQSRKLEKGDEATPGSQAFVEVKSRSTTQPKNVEECQTVCQRFGMKTLGAEYGDNPTTCSEHCLVVFAAHKQEKTIEASAQSFVELKGRSSTQPKNVEECQTVCQRFGMKSLGPAYGDNPATCSEHCTAVFGSQMKVKADQVASSSHSFAELSQRSSVTRPSNQVAARSPLKAFATFLLARYPAIAHAS